MPKKDTRTSTAAKPITITLQPSADKPTLQWCDGVRDPWKALNQGLCAVVRVAQCSDPYYALEAAKFLVEYATNEIERREARKAAIYGPPKIKGPAPPESREAVLRELQGLYAKALGEPPLIVETTAETESGK